MPPGRRSAVAAVVAVGAVVALVALSLWAAQTGPRGILRDAPTPFRTTFTPPASEQGECVPTDSAGSPIASDGPGAAPTTGVPCPPPTELPEAPPVSSTVWSTLGFIATLVLLAAAAGAAFLGLRWLLARLRDLRAREVLLEEDLVPLAGASTDALRHGLAASAADQRATLLRGEPGDAIVRCWVELERQVAALGVERRPWQTPAELTIAVMDGVGVDSAALIALADCYRRARFSEHVADESERSRALRALDRVHASLGAEVSR